MAAASSSFPSAPNHGPARRRGRPPSVDNERLLDVARQVFLERGIRATTSEVAERAGVSEGTLFHRFGTKDAMFRAAMRFDPMVKPPILEWVKESIGRPDLRAALIDLATKMLELGRVALPVMMMSWSNPASEFSLEKMFDRCNERRQFLRAICEFFESESARGRLPTSVPPKVVARLFLGSLHHYCMNEAFDPSDPDRPSVELYVRSIADLILGPAPKAKPNSKLKKLKPLKSKVTVKSEAKAKGRGRR